MDDLNENAKNRRVSSTTGGSKTKTILGLSVKMEILSVDSVSHSFKIDLWMEVGYQIKDIHGRNKFKQANGIDQFILLKQEDFPECIPPLVLYTADTMDIQSEGLEVNYFTGEMKFYRNWIVTIRDVLNLKKFPLDRQRIRVPFEATGQEDWAFTTEWPNTEPPWAGPLSIQYGICTMTNPEWKLYGYRLHIQDNVVVITIWIERNAKYYLFNYSFVAFLLVLLNWCTIGMPANDLGTRMSTTLTLLLTLVAFKFVMMSNIPKIPYLTLMDYNMLGAFGIMVFSSFWNVFLAILASGGGAMGFPDLDFLPNTLYWKQVDTIVMSSIMAVWIVIHVGLGIMVWSGWVRDSWDRVESSGDGGWDQVQVADEVLAAPVGAGTIQMKGSVDRPF